MFQNVAYKAAVYKTGVQWLVRDGSSWKMIVLTFFLVGKHFHQLHLGLVFRISGNCQLDGENLTWHALMRVPLAWPQ